MANQRYTSKEAERSIGRANTVLVFVIIATLLVALVLVGCVQKENSAGSSLDTTVPETSEDATSENNTAATDPTDSTTIPTPDLDPTRCAIPGLKGSISVPEGYYVFGDGITYTDEMCLDIGASPSDMSSAIPLLQGQALIVPADEPYSDSLHIYLKVKAKRYNDITMADLSEADYHSLASAVVSSFGVADYETVEANGLRFFVFTADQGNGNICRYATILNGHMIYIYANTGEASITEDQRAVLEHIALSIEHGL